MEQTPPDNQLRILIDALSLKEFTFRLNVKMIIEYAFRSLMVFGAIVYLFPNKLILIMVILIGLLLLIFYCALLYDSKAETKPFNPEKINKLLPATGNESKLETTASSLVAGQ